MPRCASQQNWPAHVHEWDGPAVLRPRQQAKLARGTQDKERAISHNLNSAIAVIGIDIGKNSLHVVGLDRRGAGRAGRAQSHAPRVIDSTCPQARAGSRCATLRTHFSSSLPIGHSAQFSLLESPAPKP